MHDDEPWRPTGAVGGIFDTIVCPCGNTRFVSEYVAPGPDDVPAGLQRNDVARCPGCWSLFDVRTADLLD